MAAKGTVTVKILGDNKDLSRALNDSEGKIGGWAGKVGKLAAVGVAAVGAAGVAAAVGLFKVGQSFDAEFDKIRVGTGATGDALLGLQDSFKNVLSTVPASFGDAGSAIADLNTRLGLTGKPLEDLAGQFINLSRITGTDVAANVDNLTRTFGDWEISTEDQAATLDKLYRASQASGIGIDELSQSLVTAGAPLRNLGFSIDESAALLAQFNKTGVNTDTVIAGLKAGVGKLAKAGEDVPETFSRIVDEITAMGPGTEATGLAIELFGQRAGPDMADAIAGGKFAIDDMLAAIEDGGDTINGAADETASFSEKWLLFKNRVLVGLEPIATKVFEAVGKAMDDLGPKVEPIIVWFAREIPKAVEAIRPIVEQVMAAVVSAATSVVVWFEANWPTIQATIQTVVEWLRTVAWPIIQEVAGFIVTEFSALVKAVRDNWESISETIDGVIEAVRLIVETGVAIIQNLWATFGDTLLRYVVDGWAAIKRIIGAALQTIQGIINTVTALIRGDWSAVWDGIKQTFNGVWNSIKAIVSAALTTVRAVISLAWDGIKATFGGAIDGLKEKWNGFWNGLKGVVSGVVGGIKQAIQPIIDFIQNIIDKAVAAKNAIASLNPFGKNTVSLADNVLGSTGSRLSSGSSVPRMASGGLAFSPMLAVVGDNRNARRDPEVIAPGSMIAGIVRRELDRDRSDVQRSSVVINLMDRFQVEAVVSQRDADLLMSLEAGMR